MKPSSSAVRVVIGGMTIRFLISTGPMRAGVRRMFIHETYAAEFSQRRYLAAVEIDRGAVQPAGARRDHEDDEIADILDRAEADDVVELVQYLRTYFVLRRASAL